MATEGRRTPVDLKPEPAIPPGGVADRLFSEGYAFDFFQAVRLLQRLEPERARVGRGGPPAAEAVRFRSLASLSFPASAIRDLSRGTSAAPPTMVQTFFGMIGLNGVLPRHYTELILRLQRDVRGPERTAFRDWLDLFQHRLTSLFYRAWEKYRPWLSYERGEADQVHPDVTTTALLSFIGLGGRSLQGRLGGPQPGEDRAPASGAVPAGIDDLALIYYAGWLSRRPRSAVGLRAILADYFGVPVAVAQFRGRWLYLERDDQSRLGALGQRNRLGQNAIAGDRVWDVQGMVRLRVGPLDYARFAGFLPDPNGRPTALKALGDLARLYTGPGLDLDVQLVLRSNEVPESRLGADPATGSYLGWNTWALSRASDQDKDDAVFSGPA